MTHDKASLLASATEKHFKKKEDIELIIHSITQLGFHHSAGSIKIPDPEVKDEFSAGMVNAGKIKRYLTDLKEILFTA